MNCSSLLAKDYIPSMDEFISAVGELSLVLLSLGGLITLAMIAIFLEESVYMYRRWPLRSFLLNLGCLSVFPVVAFCLFMTLLMPRSTDITTPTVILYLPLPMIFFHHLVISYTEKDQPFIQTLEGKQIPLQGPPICCICWFCPNIPFTRKRYCVIKAAIYQFLIFPFILFIASLICSHAGVFREADVLVPYNAAPYLTGLNMLSFGLGVYALVIFTRTSASLLCEFRIKGKFIALQTHFILIRLQFFTFDNLGRFGFFPCFPPISSFVTALYIRSALLLGEAFILSVVGRFVFLHPPPQDFRSPQTSALTN